MNTADKTCETCRWWGGRINGRVYSPGACRRYPPFVVVRDRHNDLQNVRPIMGPYDLCGEHHPKAEVAP